MTQADQVSGVVPDGVEVLTVPATVLQGSQARWIPLAWRFAQKLKQVKAEEHFDLVHFTDAREALFFAEQHPVVVGNVNDYYAAQLQSLGYYRRYYFDWWKRWLYYVFVHQCERVTLRRLDAIIANSQYTYKAIQQAYGLDSRRMFKCPKAIDLSLFNEVSHIDPLGELVLFVGSNMQRKGLRTLIQAAPRVLSVRPKVRFIIVGRDANLPRIRSLCHQLGVAEHFEFAGLVAHAELLNLYRQARLLVMPSLMEAFGMVFLEAMASGIPVIGSKVGGIPELIQHQENGLLVEADNPSELAVTLLAVLSDPELAARIGAHGQRTAQRFGIESMLTCTYRVYEAALTMH